MNLAEVSQSLSSKYDVNDDFFDEIDNNNNDNVTFEEISTFVRDHDFDLESEESAVANIFKSLDSNGDRILHREDFKELWASIGSALSVEEVGEWAEHAQQLPEVVAQQFLKHRITGYDFPELVEDDGELLEKELGITRHGLKKRVLKSMKLILLGAIQKPIAPSLLSAVPITCSRVKIDWEMNTPNNNTFPIHKYVVQRAVKDPLLLPLAPWNSPLPQHQWATVYEGLDTECEDWVPAGYVAADATSQVLYRVTGWNALGRSERTVVAVNKTMTEGTIPCPAVDRIFSASNALINTIRTPSIMSLLMLIISLVFVGAAGVYMMLSNVSLRRRRVQTRRIPTSAKTKTNPPAILMSKSKSPSTSTASNSSATVSSSVSSSVQPQLPSRNLQATSPFRILSMLAAPSLDSDSTCLHECLLCRDSSPSRTPPHSGSSSIPSDLIGSSARAVKKPLKSPPIPTLLKKSAGSNVNTTMSGPGSGVVRSIRGGGGGAGGSSEQGYIPKGERTVMSSNRSRSATPPTERALLIGNQTETYGGGGSPGGIGAGAGVAAGPDTRPNSRPASRTNSRPNSPLPDLVSGKSNGNASESSGGSGKVLIARRQVSFRSVSTTDDASSCRAVKDEEQNCCGVCEKSFKLTWKKW
eukprot:CAMPEP_0182439186 /NCGR_PEP_ID=MMETSP1167-20130531/86283_1 /TAXON_ID=2988 /ORGANISM="Mallomonas Sp, Strain CCMP3275" /LENGTH=640 /DNA_ID=CAMNT_0024632829 /DNA_START=8 /DNA_END=1927 /DNA_ORIENTATION=-